MAATNNWEGDTDVLPILGYKDEPPALRVAVDTSLKNKLESFIQQNGDVVHRMREASEVRVSDYGMKFDPGGMSDALSALQGMRSIARAWSLWTLHYQAQDKPDRAADAINRMIRASNSLESDPFRITGLVRISIIAMTRSDLEGLLSRHELSAKALASIENELKRHERTLDPLLFEKMELASAADGLKKPHVYGAGVIYQMERYRAEYAAQNPPQPTFLGADLDFGLQPNLPSRVMLTTTKLFMTVCPGSYELAIAHNAVNYLENVKQMPRDIEGLARMVKQRAEPEAQSTEAEDTDWSTYESIVVGHAQSRLARTGIAVEQYRLEHGRWPAGPEDLRQQWASDPFTGEPLNYAQRDNGIVIYSIGQDFEDDGGKANKVHADEEMDIVFRLFDPAMRGKRPPQTQPDESH
jgi:hypothetical protein